MEIMFRTVPIADQLARNVQRQQEAFATMAKVLAAGDATGRERAQAKIAELTAEYQRLTESLRFSELEAREIATPRPASRASRCASWRWTRWMTWACPRRRR